MSEVLIDDLTGGIFAMPATVRHRQAALHFGERPGSQVHGGADLTIGDGVADADKHGSMALWEAILMQMRMIVNYDWAPETTMATGGRSAIWPITRSPGCKAPTPAGVPVKIRSPASSLK